MTSQNIVLLPGSTFYDLSQTITGATGLLQATSRLR